MIEQLMINRTRDALIIGGGDGIYPRVTAYEVSIWPDEHRDCVDAGVWCVTVTWRGHGKWAVVRGSGNSGPCLSDDGTWVYECIPSERDDEWLGQHRYDLEAAMRLARDWAPRMRVSGKTAAEILALHLAGCHALPLSPSSARCGEPG